nr:fumarylacetoacetate hydrolase family protein [Nocardia canadensis]
MGRAGCDIPRADALEYVAGYCVGQDISERRAQMLVSGPSSQWPRATADSRRSDRG